MLASKESYVFGILNLQRHEQTDSFKGIESFINIIAQENIFVAFHFMLIRETEVFKESQQIIVTTIYTSEYLNRRANSY
jgi:hypothetical protein